MTLCRGNRNRTSPYALEGKYSIGNTGFMRRQLAQILSIVLVLLPSFASAQGTTVFAAASLQGVLDEIAAAYSGDVRISYGGSGTIARQAAAQAPVDVVVLANHLWMDWLIAQRPVLGTAPVTLAENTLVVIGPTGAAGLDTPLDLVPRLQSGRLAMGQRDAVPAGIYAQQWMKAEQIWEPLKERLAETDSVRAALALVARGESPLGIVYATDARVEDRVDIVFEIPPTEHDRIVYPAAALTDAGAAFLDYLKSETATKLFEKYGYRPATE